MCVFLSKKQGLFLNFNQHKKNFTCEALVVAALKKKTQDI